MTFIENLYHSILDSFLDTWSTLPVLLLLYFLLEWHGHSKGYGYLNGLKTKKFYSPILGALLGLIPQCGMSVILTGLYLRGLISTGTLLAVYIATSDEAFIVMIAHAENTQYILLIMVIKFIAASFLGILIDKVFKLSRPVLKDNMDVYNAVPVKIEPLHSAGKHDWHKIRYKDLFLHAVKHSFNIYFYIFTMSAIIFFSFNYFDINKIPSILFQHNYLEIIITTLFGLIPNCVATVAIAEAFLNSSLSLGAVIAGLSSASGLGLLMLFKEAKLKTSARIVTVLVVYAMLLGFIVNSIYPLRLPPTKLNYNEHVHHH